MLFGDLQEMCVKNSSQCVALVFIKCKMTDWFLTTVTNYFKFRTHKSDIGLFTAKKMNTHIYVPAYYYLLSELKYGINFY